MARRAVASEDKQARRAAILEAARKLFFHGDGSLPTVSQVAAATGLAKGTVYLYFQTKEEIFATLLLEGWAPVLEAVQTTFDSTKGKEREKTKAFIKDLVGYLEQHSDLLRLDALGSAVLEKNMTPGALRQFKQNFAAYLMKAGTSIDKSLRLTEGRGVEILMRTYALTRGLWQSAQHDKRALMPATIPALMLTTEQYFPELKAALTEYWRGALA